MYNRGTALTNRGIQKLARQSWGMKSDDGVLLCYGIQEQAPCSNKLWAGGKGYRGETAQACKGRKKVIGGQGLTLWPSDIMKMLQTYSHLAPVFSHSKNTNSAVRRTCFVAFFGMGKNSGAPLEQEINSDISRRRVGFTLDGQYGSLERDIVKKFSDVSEMHYPRNSTEVQVLYSV